jgi:predicted membrane protein
MDTTALSLWFFGAITLVLWLVLLILVIRFAITTTRRSRNETGEVAGEKILVSLWDRKIAVVALLALLIAAVIFPMESSKWRPKTDIPSRDSERQELFREIERSEPAPVEPAVDVQREELDKAQEQDEQKVQDVLDRFKNLPDAGESVEDGKITSATTTGGVIEDGKETNK